LNLTPPYQETGRADAFSSWLRSLCFFATLPVFTCPLPFDIVANTVSRLVPAKLSEAPLSKFHNDSATVRPPARRRFACGWRPFTSNPLGSLLFPLMAFHRLLTRGCFSLFSQSPPFFLHTCVPVRPPPPRLCSFGIVPTLPDVFPFRIPPSLSPSQDARNFGFNVILIVGLSPSRPPTFFFIRFFGQIDFRKNSLEVAPLPFFNFPVNWTGHTPPPEKSGL